MRYLGKTLYVLLALGLSGFCANNCFAYEVSANSIYFNAKRNNINYLRLIKRYRNAINVVDNNGNSAYCIALKNNDKNTLEVLKQWGADSNHECVKNLRKRTERKSNVVRNNDTAKRTVRYANTGGSNYALWGLGAVGVAGGVAALSGGGGGGGKSSSAGGNTGCGGNNDDVGGGDNNVIEPTISYKEFQTNEYKKGNFLDSINASKAYTYMYKKDENGKLVSHQADSDEKLEEVKVGVIDAGVANNNELKGKIQGGYDLNYYNSDGDIYGYDAGNRELYLYKSGGKYYAFYNFGGSVDKIFNYAYSENELTSLIEDINEEYGINIKFEDFNILNGSEGGTPGVTYTKGVGQTEWDVAFNKIANIGHGTHVAGIIAGNKDGQGMHGVAFENAKIVPVSWDFGHNIFGTVESLVNNGVEVINNSWGEPTAELDQYGNIDKETRNIKNINQLYFDDPDTLMAFAYAAQNDAVWVQATGNEHTTQPTIYAGMGDPNFDLSAYGFNGAGKYEAPYLAVTALGFDGKIASYANRCGDAKGWCIAAPGTVISSSVAIEDGVGVMSGTSMATPVVSGSIALLKGYYPWLNAQNVAYILLETANDKGVYADSNIYGKGALDLEAAVTTPIGNLGLPKRGDLNNLASVSSSKLSTSGVLQNKLIKSMPKTITAYDALKRPFKYETSKLINTTHSSSANLKDSVSRMAMANSGVKTIKDEKTGFQFSSRDALDNSGTAKLSSMEVVHQTEGGSNRFYYADNSKYITSDNVLQNDSNPYLAMKEAYGAESMLNLSDSSKLKLSIQSGKNGLYERDEDQDSYDFDERSYSLGGEYSFNMSDYLELSALGGMLYEEDAMLGLNGVGGFGINGSNTYYMGLKAKLDLTSKVSLMAAYYRGYTGGNKSDMLSISDLETESFMLVGEYQSDRNNKFGLMFRSPMSVVKGDASFRYSTGRDNYSNTAYLRELKTTLRPEAREYDLGMYYEGEPSDNLSISGKVEARFNADGEKGVEDYVGVVGAHYTF